MFRFGNRLMKQCHRAANDDAVIGLSEIMASQTQRTSAEKYLARMKL